MLRVPGHKNKPNKSVTRKGAKRGPPPLAQKKRTGPATITKGRRKPVSPGGGKRQGEKGKRKKGKAIARKERNRKKLPWLNRGCQKKAKMSIKVPKQAQTVLEREGNRCGRFERLGKKGKIQRSKKKLPKAKEVEINKEKAQYHLKPRGYTKIGTWYRNVAKTPQTKKRRVPEKKKKKWWGGGRGAPSPKRGAGRT